MDQVPPRHSNSRCPLNQLVSTIKMGLLRRRYPQPGPVLSNVRLPKITAPLPRLHPVLDPLINSHFRHWIRRVNCRGQIVRLKVQLLNFSKQRVGGDWSRKPLLVSVWRVPCHGIPWALGSE